MPTIASGGSLLYDYSMIQRSNREDEEKKQKIKEAMAAKSLDVQLLEEKLENSKLKEKIMILKDVISLLLK